jgi:anaerobic magnesium-protoporphyrin IX monomethyl ester cyclase
MACNHILFIETRPAPKLWTSQSDRFPMLGIGYLISYIQSRYPHIQCFLRSHYNVDIALIKGLQPDLIAISATTPMFDAAASLSKRLEPLGIPIIIGGVHITSMMESLPKEIILGVCGEGEETILEIVEILQNGDTLTPSILSTINGIVFRQTDGSIKSTPHRPRIHDLDSLPMPDRSKMNITRGGRVHMLTSRGCPFRCSFCSSSHFWGNKIRFRGVDSIIEEIEFLIKKYAPRMLCFYDDFFLANHKRFFSIAERILSLGIHKKTRFFVTSRASHITAEVCEVLEKMNTRIVFMGFESASPKVLSYLKPEQASPEIYDTATELLKRYNLIVSASFIIGSPEETIDDIRQTFQYIAKSRIDSVGIYPLVAYPGTKVWEDAIRLGVINPKNVDWERINDWERHFLPQRLSHEEMKKWLSKLYREQFRRRLIFGLRHLLPFRPYSVYH